MKEGMKYDNSKRVLYTMMKQFSLALNEVTKCSEYGHNKYQLADDDWDNFSRLDNAYDRYSNGLVRHLLDKEEYDESGISHDAHVAWNALARLECKLRENENKSSKQNRKQHVVQGCTCTCKP